MGKGCRATIAFVAAFLLHGPALAQERTESEAVTSLGGWSLFLETGVLAHVETMQMKTDSTLLVDDPVSANGASERSTQTSSVSALFFDVGAGSTSPKIDFLPGEPRLRIRGGVLVPMADDSTIRSDAENRMYANPEGPAQTLEDQITIRGDADWGEGWYASLGMQVELSLEWDVRVTASAHYLGRQLEYAGSIDRAFEDRRRVPAPFVMIPDTSVSTRPAETTNHFLGPGLSLEAPFVGFGPFRFSIYLDARVLFRLDGGRAISSATPQVVTDNLGRSFEATADIGFEPAKWAFNGSGGFRLEFY